MTDGLIAVVGMACRLPGAHDLEEYWVNLASGVESISSPTIDGPRAGPRMPDVDRFDADLFEMTADEARRCDPQIRTFIETCHAALENAGYDPFGTGECVGVFGSVGPADHLQRVPRSRPDLIGGAAPPSALDRPDHLATLTSYELNLHGPSMTVLSAGSGSLVAAHVAAQSLRAGECDLAIAGGSVIDLPLGRRSGAGVVVLRRLADAIAAGDDVKAVIRGSAVNNDGADKVSYGASSVSGQAVVVAEAMALAGVHPVEVGHVETGALGDPVEAAALGEAFSMLADDRLPRASTAIGSVTSTIGHPNAVSGVAGLIKTVLMLEREAIVPTIGVTAPRSQSDLDSTPFTIATELRGWPREADRPRVASVSASGIGGTNVHMVVGDMPEPHLVPAPAPGAPPHVVVCSGRSDRAVAELRTSLAGYFATHGDERFADAVATLQHGRTAHPVRLAAVCSDAADATKALTDPARQLTGRADPDASTVLLFPGMDTLPPRAAIGLYGTVRAFTVVMDECLELFERAGARLYDAWHADEPANDPVVAQPLLFAVQYALGAMWRDFGVEPHAVLGYGLGEITAAAIAGVLDLPAAVAAVHARAMGRHPSGGDTREAADTAALPMRPPRIPLCSGSTGRLFTGTVPPAPGFLTGRFARPALLDEALRTVLDSPHRLLLDVGPGTALDLGGHPTVDSPAHVVAGLPAGKEDRDGIAHAVADLWVHGVNVDFEAAGHPAPSRRVAVPGYPYQRKRHWIDPSGDAAAPVGPRRLGALDTAASAAGPDAGEPSPFSTVEWVRRSRPATGNGGARGDGAGSALVLLPDDGEQAARVLLALRLAGYRATAVRRGPGFAEANGEFDIGGADELRRVVSVMEEGGERLDAVVHAAGMTAFPAVASAQLPIRVDATLGSAVAFAELVLGRRPGPGMPAFHMLTTGAVDVSGDDRLDPDKAMLLGVARGVLADASGVRGGAVDIGDRVSAADIAAEIRLGDPARVVALRGRNRWLPVERPLVLPAADPGVREDGVYVITSGLGRPSPAVAQALGDELRARGADLHPIAADVADRNALRAELAGLTTRLGPVSGLFHLTQDSDPTTSAPPEAPGAADALTRAALGTTNLAEVFADAPPLDFTVSFSGRTGTGGLVASAADAACHAFLDAMAATRPSLGHPVSISCPVMPDTARPDTAGDPEQPAATMTWELEFGARTHWMLDEHRAGQTPMMPETAWLDLVTGLFGDEFAAPGAAIELRDVAFHEPLAVQEVGSVRVALTPADAGYGFAIWSATEHGRVPHASGRISGYAGSAPVADLAALTTRMTDTGRRGHLPEGHPFTIGPRWHNVTATAQAGREKLVSVELMSAFAADMLEHRLHPALLDTVTAALLAAGEGSFAPAAISRMRVYGDLPTRFHGHLRRAPASATPAVVGDVDLIAPDGTVLVSIDGFTARKRATGDPVPSGQAAGGAVSTASPRPGLDPVECAQVMMRALAGRAEGPILVRPDAGRCVAAEPGEEATGAFAPPATPSAANG